VLVAPSLAYSGATLRDDDDPALLAGLLTELRNTSPRMTGQPDRVAMYLSTADVVALRGAGVRAHPLLLEPDAWIELPGGGWEGYLDQLGTSRRRTVRREIRRFQEAGCSSTPSPPARAAARPPADGPTSEAEGADGVLRRWSTEPPDT
jgi:hypothetical protein